MYSNEKYPSQVLREAVEAAVPADRESVAVEIAPADGAPADGAPADRLRAPAVDGLARFDVPPRAASIVVR